MRTFTFALMATCILGSPLMADECPAPEKISETLTKGFEELKKNAATAAGIKTADIADRLSLSLGMHPGTDLTKLSMKEESSKSSPELKYCVYSANDGNDKKITVLAVIVNK